MRLAIVSWQIDMWRASDGTGRGRGREEDGERDRGRDKEQKREKQTVQIAIRCWQLRLAKVSHAMVRACL